MSHFPDFFRSILLLWPLLLLPLCLPAGAATLFGVVSQRSAAELAAGADRFLAAYPGHRLVLRTPQQLAGLSDRALTALWQEADTVLLAAVFGEQVPRLERLLRTNPPQSLLAFHGDRRLTRARALDLLEQLEGEYRKLLAGDGDRQRAQSLYRALAATGIEGLGGWG
ncbi:MAG: hypothetical protein R3310_00715 [Candidatus Competibacteraceae bacterium]|nr:hypothetical protein [Candidatus Competibacteraceae bacterium]